MQAKRQLEMAALLTVLELPLLKCGMACHDKAASLPFGSNVGGAWHWVGYPGTVG